MIPTAESDGPEVSVVICTYNRPLMLQEALATCLAHATCAGLAFEVVIADNSPERHAQALVHQVASGGAAVAVRWVPAAPPNISIARNAGLRAARGRLVAFLDDDLQVQPGWLDALVATLGRSGADVVIGPVRPAFAAGHPPRWDPQGARFTRVLAACSGAPIRAGGAARTRGFAISTANSLWHAARCFADPAPFDPTFGASGGEDLDLFLRLEAQGRRFAWCAEAELRETIPAARSTLGYHVLRAYSGAQVYAAAVIKNIDGKPRAAIDLMLRGAVQAAGFGAAVPLLFLLGRTTAWPSALLAAAAGLGKLLWWRRLKLYHVEKRPV